MCIFASIYKNVRKDVKKMVIIRSKMLVIVYAYFNEEHKGINLLCQMINCWNIAVVLSWLFINRMMEDIQSNHN